MNVQRPDKPAGTDTWLDIKGWLNSAGPSYAPSMDGWYNVIVPWLRWCVGEIAYLRSTLAKAQRGVSDEKDK